MNSQLVRRHGLGQFDDLFFEFGPVLQDVHQSLRAFDLLDDLGVVLDEFERRFPNVTLVLPDSLHRWGSRSCPHHMHRSRSRGVSRLQR